MEEPKTGWWRGRGRGRFPLAAPAALLACLFARPAAADGTEFQVAAGLSAGYLSTLPALSADRVSTTARDIHAGDVGTRGGLWLLGVTADLQLTLSDRWTMPLVGMTAAWAVGRETPIGTSFDGSIARVRPDTAFRGDLLLPGIGGRWKHRRFMYGIAARTGVSWLSMDGSVAAGTTRTPLDLTTVTFLFQVEAEGCRRLDPELRMCLQIVPRVYEHQFMNGVTFGLRVEWGR